MYLAYVCARQISAYKSDIIIAKQLGKAYLKTLCWIKDIQMFNVNISKVNTSAFLLLQAAGFKRIFASKMTPNISHNLEMNIK